MGPGPHDPFYPFDRFSGRPVGPAAGPAGESIGEVLIRVRMAQGRSQLRLAELLCAAAGMPTVTRHEVSRWEREERIPSGFWLGWLAVVLEVPLPTLEAAAALARAERGGQRPVARTVAGLAEFPADPFTGLPGRLPGSLPPEQPTGAVIVGPAPSVEEMAARLTVLRRMDDLVGGADLAAVVRAELRRAVAAHPIGSATPAEISQIAQLAQLTSWVLADAGALASALATTRTALRAATAAGDRPLTAHLLGCLCEATADQDQLTAARRLSRTTSRMIDSVPAPVRALQLYRIAYAAGRAGRAGEAEQALTAADQLATGYLAGSDPPWLYWLDETSLMALAGRCHAMLGRPRRARALLAEALEAGTLPPRARALCGAWLGAARAESGDVEGACEAARQSLLSAVRSGSVRAARQARGLDARLRGDRRGGCGRGGQQRREQPQRAERRGRRTAGVARYVGPANRLLAYLPDARGASVVTIGTRPTAARTTPTDDAATG